VIEGLRVAGKRKRLFFRTKAAADLELARIKHKQAREGQDALAISDALRIMARDCATLLEPHGKSLADATSFYLEYLEKLSRSISVGGLVSEYQESRRRAGLSRVHLADLNYRLGRFTRDFGPQPVRTLTPEAIEDWLHQLGLGPKSYNNFRSRLSALFSYGCARRYLDENPTEALSPSKIVAAPPEIFTPAELAAVLAHTDEELLPALVLGAFTGVRTAELLRLSWADVDLSGGYVHVAAAKAKSARRRLIPIPDNLREWLAPYGARVGQVCALREQYYHRACARTAHAAGLVRWPKNGLRHSFASYYLAYHQNAPELSLHMGHTNVRQLFESYREVVTKEAGARYWVIRPTQTPANVVTLKLEAAS
jgi:integrase